MGIWALHGILAGMLLLLVTFSGMVPFTTITFLLSLIVIRVIYKIN